MKVKAILTEDTELNASAQHVHKVFSALSPFHISLLKRIASGQVDAMDGLSEKSQELADQLVEFGLLDSAYGITPAGSRAISFAKKLGSAELRDVKKKAALRRAIRNKEAKLEPVIPDDSEDEDMYVHGTPTSDLVADEDFDGEDEELPVVVAKKKKKVAAPRTKELRADDFSSFDKDEDDYLNDDGEYKWS